MSPAPRMPPPPPPDGAEQPGLLADVWPVLVLNALVVVGGVLWLVGGGG